MGRKRTTSPRKIQVAERRQVVLSHRARGKTYAEVVRLTIQHFGLREVSLQLSEHYNKDVSIDDVVKMNRGGQVSYKEIETAGRSVLPKSFNDMSAQTDVERVLEFTRREMSQDADKIRALMLTRCNMMMNGAMPKAEAGDTAAIDAVLKIQVHQIKLSGLDLLPPMPTQDAPVVKMYDVSVNPDDWPSPGDVIEGEVLSISENAEVSEGKT